MELQALSRAVRIGQKQMVVVVTPYVNESIDERHKVKHMNKIVDSNSVTGDSRFDDLYAMLREHIQKREMAKIQASQNLNQSSQSQSSQGQSSQGQSSQGQSSQDQSSQSQSSQI